MPPTAELPLDRPLPEPSRRREAIVQDRPTLGSLPRTSRGPGWWLLPAIDLIAAALALVGIALVEQRNVFPALPVSALLLVGVNGALGVYGSRPTRAFSVTRAGWRGR